VAFRETRNTRFQEVQCTRFCSGFAGVAALAIRSLSAYPSGWGSDDRAKFAMKRMLWTLALTFLAASGGGAWYSHHETSAARAERWSLQLEEDAADARLDRLVRLDGRQVTLGQLRDLVSAETGLDVRVDSDAIVRVQGDPAALTFRLPIGRFALRDALDRLLNSRDLAYEIRGSSLDFITQDAVADHLQTVTYPLPAIEQTTEDDWVNLITQCIEIHAWDEVGGRGHLEPVAGALVVVQTPAVHRKLRAALAILSELESPPESLEPCWLLPPCNPARRREMLAILDQKVSVTIENHPLSQIVAELASRHGISLGMDVERITEAGVSIDQPVTLRMENITLRSVLAELLSQMELAVSDRGDSLVITTPENAEDELPVVAYPVHDLAWIDGFLDFDSLIELITTHVSPNSWGEGNNNRVSTLGSGWLVLPQTAEVHAQVESLLARLRTGVAAGGEPVVANLQPAAVVHERIRTALRRPIALDLDGTPLRQIFARLAAELQIQILLDERRLREAGVSTDLPITWHVPAIPLGSQLYWMLREPDLMWTIRDECLIITTTAETEWEHPARIYDVRNLTDPDLGLPGGFEVVQTLIEKLVPDSLSPHRGWRDVTEVQGLLVISESAQVHDKVEQLLVALETHCRQASSSPVGQPLEVRLDPSSSAERIERILGEKISVNYCGVPLEDVLRDLARLLELPVAFDRAAVVTEGYDFREFISISAHERPLVEILDELFETREFAYEIRQDVLFFTFKARRSEQRLQTRLFRVGDLLPLRSATELSKLAKRLASIDATYWHDVQGGPGTVLPVGTEWLAVSADWRNHQQVTQWLEFQRGHRPQSPSPDPAGAEFRDP
jgi:hypothetical protein